MTEKDRLTVNFDKDVFEGILAMRANPEWARKSLGKIVNDLIKIALEKEKPAS